MSYFIIAVHAAYPAHAGIYRDKMSDEERDNVASLIVKSVSKHLISKTYLRGLAEFVDVRNRILATTPELQEAIRAEQLRELQFSR